MAGDFFTSWQTWEKLVFILACAIVLTLLAGCVKLVYSHWKLRKYSAIVEKEKQASALQGTVQQPQYNSQNDVPFGIRAIESGIEVEGVWISRTNTPDLVSRASSQSWDVVPLKDGRPETDTLVTEPRGRSGSSSVSTLDKTALMSGTWDRAVSAERNPSNRSSRTSSPDAVAMKPYTGRHPPLSFAKYSNNPYLTQQSFAWDAQRNTYRHSDLDKTSIALESRDAQADTTRPADQSKSIDDGSIVSAAPLLLDVQPRREKDYSVDFDLMHNHRLSQAAETGQLTPRIRRYGSDDGSVCRSNKLPPGPSIDRNSYFNVERSQSPLPQDGRWIGQACPQITFSPPQLDMLPAMVRKSSMPDVTPFTQFCKTTPSSPQSEHYEMDSWVHRGSEGSGDRSPDDRADVSEEPIAPDEPVAPLVSTLNQGPASQGATNSRPTTFEKRGWEVLRGHGTGFEILRPGTLKPVLPSDQTAPPISLHNVFPRSRSGSRSRSRSSERRKLQKKRRAST